MITQLLNAALERLAPPPAVLPPIVVTEKVRLVTIKDIAVFKGWPESRILGDGSQVGKAMAARYRELTGREPYEVTQVINGTERLVFAYEQRWLSELAKVWRD